MVFAHIVLFDGQNVGIGIELLKLLAPLRHHGPGDGKYRLLANAHAFHFHGGCRHGEGFSGADFMSQKRISSEDALGNAVCLMGSQLQVLVHPGELQHAAVIGTRHHPVQGMVVVVLDADAGFGIKLGLKLIEAFLKAFPVNVIDGMNGLLVEFLLVLFDLHYLVVNDAFDKIGDFQFVAYGVGILPGFIQQIGEGDFHLAQLSGDHRSPCAEFVVQK